MAKKTVKRKKVKSKKSKSWKNFLFRGDAAISALLIVAVVIAGSFMLIGGIAPKIDNSKVNFDNTGEPITPTALANKNNLVIRTFKLQQCSDKGIYFLIDVSGSMAFSASAGKTKLDVFKEALTSFADKLGAKSPIGLRTFSDVTTLNLPIASGNKSKLKTTIQSLSAIGGTHTKDGFTAALNDLNSMPANLKTNEYSFIFFSDGIPETLNNNIACPGGPGSPLCQTSTEPPFGCRCFAESQDPSSVVSQIKDLTLGGKKVKIYSILLFDAVRDAYYSSKFQPLMQSIATTPSGADKTFFVTTNANDLKTIFDQVGQRVCNG